ncbi:MAG: hypothetical protein GC137_10315 [Alphaproteobacteria bacterium]|nr:hypothetical protein [Alphaproteobacteria bacterium]
MIREYPATEMGKVITNVGDLKNPSPVDIRLITDSVLRYGVICIKAQDMGPADIENLVTQMGEKIVLPPVMAFNNQVQGHPAVAKVSNIGANGVLIPNYDGAEYWHQDGDFNPGIRKSVWNVLHAKTVPPVGGQTGFADGRRILKVLPREILEALQGKNVTVDPA